MALESRYLTPTTAPQGDSEHANPIQSFDCFDCERRDGRRVLFGCDPDDRSGRCHEAGDPARARFGPTSQFEWHLAGDDDSGLGPAGPFHASGSRAARSLSRCSCTRGARARLGFGRGRAPRPRVVEGDAIPYKPEAAAKKKENAEHWLDRDPEVRCYMPGIPRAMYMPYPFQITQGTNKIEMSFEFAGASRTIHLDPVDPPPADTWMGHSVGHWEGNTLVVDVSHFNDRTWFSRSGDFHSDALHVVERFTPVNSSLRPDALRYEVTIEDPNVFTRPWKMSMVLYRQLEPNAQLMEYKCTELVEETFLGHLRKKQLVKHWEGETIVIDVTRKVPAGDKLYER